MIQIYFDDILIDEDYYTSLSTSFSLFSDTFYLGSTASNVYTISIAKEVVKVHPNIVTIKNDGLLVGTLVVDKIEENDFEYTYTLTDKMVNLEFNYDASEIFTNGSATLLEIAQDICNKAGIELATMNFRSYDKGINWYDNTRTAREYIGYISELNGGYAQIGKDGRLYFIKQNTPSAKTISIDDCADFKIGEKHKITRVVYELGALKYEYGDESGNTLYLNGDNVYITDQTEVEEIYNEIKGFEFYSFNTSNCPIDYNIMAGQVITFVDGENSYPTIAGYDELTFNGDWYGGYNLDVATKKQEETQIIGTSEKIRNLSIKVDRESNKITQAIKEIDDQNNKISQVTQTVNELNSKIGDIADITTSKETINASLSIEKINQSEPIYVRIYPTGTNISYLYPRENLYPSETLFMSVRTLRFINTTTKEYVDYELPTDLLYYDAENYDEFILDYDAQTCVVNKRVGYNADGTTHVLDNPQTIEYEYPRIELTDGDYTITLLGYHNAYMLVRLMAQNIYTTQFATKAEVNSEISQTTQAINIGVDKKLTNYATKTEMNAAINVKANEITSEVSEAYETKDSATTNYSKLTQTATSLQSQISANDTDISTIKQSVNEVDIEVGKKYNTSDFTNAKITAKLNDGTSSAQISADKIDLSATDILNLLAGNEINLTSKNIILKSTNFSVDKNGNLTCSNANITGGNINLQDSGDYTDGKIVSTNTNNSSREAVLYSDGLWVRSDYNGNIGGSFGSTQMYISNSSTTGNEPLYGVVASLGNYNTNPYLKAFNTTSETKITPSLITTPSVSQTSLAEQKKNFEKMQDNAIDIIKNIDIYKYNLKSENDTDKKHIGFVIGDEYNYSEEVTSLDNKGVDNYSFTSLCCKAIQEQQELIEQLQKEIKQLKGEN